MFGKFVNWLGGGKSTRDYIIELKMVNKRLARSSKKLEKDEAKLQRKTREANTANSHIKRETDDYCCSEKK